MYSATRSSSYRLRDVSAHQKTETFTLSAEKDSQNTVTMWHNEWIISKIQALNASDAITEFVIELHLEIQNIFGMDKNNIFDDYYCQNTQHVQYPLRVSQPLHFHHDFTLNNLCKTKWKEDDVIHGPFFDINGSKWQIVLAVSRHHTMIVLQCVHIPHDVSAIHIYNNLIIRETNSNHSSIAVINPDSDCDGWFEDKLCLMENHLVADNRRVNKLHFNLELAFIEVYGKENNLLTDKYSKVNPSNAYNECPLVQFSSYMWRIPFLNNSKCIQLCHGYIRSESSVSTHYIPNDIRQLIILYYDGSNLINDIKSASNCDQFDSELFLMYGFPFFMEIYPNGLSAETIADVDWYLTLASLSPNISRVYFAYKVHVLETDTKWLSVSTFFHGNPSLGWPEGTLATERLQHLESITFKISIAVFDVVDNHKNRIGASQYLQLQSKSTHDAMDTFQWNITDELVLSRIKHAKYRETFDSPVFTIFDLKFYIRFYPNFANDEAQGEHEEGHDQDNKTVCGLYVRMCSIPPNISSVAMKYRFICKQTGSEFQSNAQFTENHSAEGCRTNSFLYLQQLHLLSCISFKIEFSLIDIYDDSGAAITAKWIENMHVHDIDNDCNERKKETESYEWKITDAKQIQTIKDAKNGDSFCSDIFYIFGLKWSMELCPMGDNKHNEGNVDWYFHLASLPSNIAKICVYYKIVFVETGTIDSHSTSFMLKHTSYGWGTDTLDYSQLLDIESITFRLYLTILDIYDIDGNKVNYNYFMDTIIDNRVNIACVKVFEWRIVDDISSIICGESMESDRFTVGVLNGWYLTFYPNGTNEECQRCSEVFLSLSNLASGVNSISFYFELILVETNTKYSNFIHFKDDYLSKGWTPYKMHIDEIEHLKEITLRVNIKLIDVYDDKHRAVTDIYESNMFRQ